MSLETNIKYLIQRTHKDFRGGLDVKDGHFLIVLVHPQLGKMTLLVVKLASHFHPLNFGVRRHGLFQLVGQNVAHRLSVGMRQHEFAVYDVRDFQIALKDGIEGFHFDLTGILSDLDSAFDAVLKGI